MTDDASASMAAKKSVGVKCMAGNGVVGGAKELA